MKVTVIKPLNVRVGAPSVNAPCYQYITPGSELEVDGQLYSGDVYDNINTWLKDAANNYYWSGGVQTDGSRVADISGYDEFLKQFPGDGANVGVAFLDSGVNELHPQLKSVIKYYESFLPSKSKISTSDHGNKVAGILASSDVNIKRNKSNLFCFRVAEGDDTVNSQSVVDALNEINEKMSDKIDVINMSINIRYTYVEIIQPIINALTAKGILIVAASGENNYLNNIAFLNNIVKVGCFDDYKVNDIKKVGLNPKYSQSFLNRPISTYSKFGSELDDKIDQDSAYSAVASSTIARWISSGNHPKDASRISNANTFLSSWSQSIKSELLPKPFNFYI